MTLFYLVCNFFLKKTLRSINIFWRDDELSEDDAASLLTTLPGWDWKKPLCAHAITDKYLEKVNLLSNLAL